MPFGVSSIRARLTLWYSLLVISTLLLFGGLSYYYTRTTLSENLDKSLTNEARWVRDFIQPQASKVRPGRRSIEQLLRRAPASRPPPPDSTETEPEEEEADEIWNKIYEHTLLSPKKTFIQVADRRGSIIYRSISLGPDSLPVRHDSVALNATLLRTTNVAGVGAVRVAATRDKNFTILVGYPLDELRDVLENLYWVFLILIPIALGVSVFGGFYLAKKSLRPVDEVTTRARRITVENLDQTIPERTADDEIGRLISTMNDMIKRLHHSVAQIRQFSADASHELRTPLTVMRGEIELALRSSKPPEEYRRVLQSALEEIMRMSSIIENLLVLAKADQGIYEAHFGGVDMVSLIQELFDDSEILAEPKRIHVTLTHTALITLVGDKERLRQLFLNLIDNAIKYTPAGGSLTLSLEKRNGVALVQVADTGIGIPPEEIDKVFDRFYRVDKARSRELGGAGLGLSIAKWIAELHRGRITVESEPNIGSTFTVHLPIN
jgi:heavy metal sensor kinase